MNNVNQTHKSQDEVKLPAMCSADCYIVDESNKVWDAVDEMFRCLHCRRAIGVIHWFGKKADKGCDVVGIAS